MIASWIYLLRTLYHLTCQNSHSPLLPSNSVSTVRAFLKTLTVVDHTHAPRPGQTLEDFPWTRAALLLLP